ncbi:hypothetical protein EKK58_06115 [Candidatus Dependentiae bacterium]|nr:MAG: hypothetical protein EKK58_06115 [Candidatus Dependentiae bacterium]
MEIIYDEDYYRDRDFLDDERPPVQVIHQQVKSEKLLEDFTQFCNRFPDLRFWQALRSWSGAYAIMYKDHLNQEEDTFYWDKKSKNE